MAQDEGIRAGAWGFGRGPMDKSWPFQSCYRKGRALLDLRQYVVACEYLDEIMQGKPAKCSGFCLSSSRCAKLEA